MTAATEQRRNVKSRRAETGEDGGSSSVDGLAVSPGRVAPLENDGPQQDNRKQPHEGKQA
jgi:hypothetical protein